jgi:NADH:ubiquinone oxidoreductase subunit 4 (subunit M)
MLIPVLILIVWMGMYSNHFLRPMDASVTRLLQQTRENAVEFAVIPK